MTNHSKSRIHRERLQSRSLSPKHRSLLTKFKLPLLLKHSPRRSNTIFLVLKSSKTQLHPPRISNSWAHYPKKTRDCGTATVARPGRSSLKLRRRWVCAAMPDRARLLRTSDSIGPIWISMQRPVAVKGRIRHRISQIS